jgi:hypothetical protein
MKDIILDATPVKGCDAASDDRNGNVLDPYVRLLSDRRIVFVIVCNEGGILLMNIHIAESIRVKNPQPPDFSIPVAELSLDGLLKAMATRGISDSDKLWFSRTTEEISRLWSVYPTIIGQRKSEACI